jgi:predicted DNA-binding transcriptional regulator AlpA
VKGQSIRKFNIDLDEFKEMYSRGLSMARIADHFGITRMTCYRIRNRLGLPKDRSLLEYESIASEKDYIRAKNYMIQIYREDKDGQQDNYVSITQEARILIGQ